MTGVQTCALPIFGQAYHGDRVDVSTQMLGADPKRLHLFHTMTDANGAVIATAEQMLVHVDTVSGRSCPALGEVADAVAGLAAAQADLAQPDAAGRRIVMPPPAPPLAAASAS